MRAFEMRLQTYPSSKDLGFVIQLQLPVSVGALLDPESVFSSVFGQSQL
jgi:hypothetical protein